MSYDTLLRELWDGMRHAAKVTGKAALTVLLVLGEAIERYENQPAPCDGCRRTFIRKSMHRLYDVPAANKPFSRFCGECAERLRALHQYEGMLRDERRKLLVQLARAMERGLPATLTLEQWIATLNRFGWRCAYCREAPYEAIEHYIPIERGGGTTADNCVPACTQCNSAKGMRHPDEIRESSRSPVAVARVGAYLLTQRPAHAVTQDTLDG